jgi:HlyD family secretion protein
MQKWIKRLGLVGLLIAIAGGFIYSMRERPVLIDIAVIASGSMEVTIRQEGTTRVRSIYTVSSPISGYLARTTLEIGDRVVAGKDIVASIRPPNSPLLDTRTEAELVAARNAAQTAVDIASFELAKAETAAQLAEDNLERAIRLAASGTISDKSLQASKSEAAMQAAQVSSAQAAVAMRKAEVASAEARLSPTSILVTPDGECCIEVSAPITGTVLNIYAESEQAIAAGTRIMDLGDTSDLEVSVDLLSSDAVQIAPGVRATITDWGGDMLEGQVQRVEPAAFTKVSALGVEEQRVNTVVRLNKTDSRLGHGYRVLVDLVIWRSQSCLQVPISALFRNGQDWSVFVVENSRVRQEAITIGRMNDRYAQVLDGLAAGQTVVVHPGDTLADGRLIEVRP